MAELFVDVVALVEPVDVPEVRFDDPAFPSWPVSVRIDADPENPSPLLLRFRSELQLQRWALSIAATCRRRAGRRPAASEAEGPGGVDRIMFDVCIDESCGGRCGAVAHGPAGGAA